MQFLRCLLSDHWPAKHKRWGPCAGSCATQVQRTFCSLAAGKSLKVVILPHFSSFFDAIMVFASGFPYMVNRVENLSIPLMGACIQVWYSLHIHIRLLAKQSNFPFQFNQTIFVSREGADSRSKAVNMIKERVGIWSIKSCFYLSSRSFHPSLGHSLLFGLRALALIGNKFKQFKF